MKEPSRVQTHTVVAGRNVVALAPQSESLLSGGQAVARGAVEAGVAVAIGYPGSPGTEAIETLLAAAGPELRVEWAVNEKVAVEIAAGVAWSGKRALVAMKMSGLNVAADSVLSVASSGVNGGLVILVGDDANAYYGMVEQDSRYYALMGALPLLEPASAQEALDLTRDAFELSERSGAPILLRLTTVLANSVAPVTVHAPERTRVRGQFALDPDRYTKAGAARVRAQHEAALVRAADVARMLGSMTRREPGAGRVGAVGVGVAWQYLLEARAKVAPEAPLLKLPASYPLPEAAVLEFLGGLDRVLVVEELEPVLETAIRTLAGGRPGLVVLGKLAAGGAGPLLSRVGDLDVDGVAAALQAAAQLEPAPAGVGAAPAAAARVGALAGVPNGAARPAEAEAPGPAAARTPVFPAGCPHRGSYLALQHALRQLKLTSKDVVVTGDVGCSVVGALDPVSTCATEIAMGASIGVAQGFAYAKIGKPVIAAIGDGAFFHAGLSALAGAVHRQVDLTVLVLDNGTSCLTGGQPHAGSPGQPEGTAQIKIEDLARACLVRRVTVVDPYEVKRTAAAIVQAVRGGGVSVVIARRPCEAFLPKPPAPPLEIRAKRCVGVAECQNSCIAVTACPALQVDAAGKARIEPSACVGCRLCEAVCPTRAIRRPWRFGAGAGAKVVRG
jgi:indolepyruvate ferredoxin oxidoreductase alpha subunit